jgi:hypothetical protein
MNRTQPQIRPVLMTSGIAISMERDLLVALPVVANRE